MKKRQLLRYIPIIIDWVLLLAALFAIAYLTLEDLGVNISFISENQGQLVFVGICLLIISSTWERRTMLSGLDNKIDDLVTSNVHASQVFRSRKTEHPLLNNLEDIKSASFCGASLSTTVQQYRDEFVRLAKQGKSFRFLIVNPKNYIEEREEKVLTNRSTIIQFEKLLTETPKGRISVQMIDRYPPCKIIIINRNKPKKNLMIVEFFGYKTSNIVQPFVLLYEDKDPYWYDYFLQMFEKMWKDSQPLIAT